jgi:hypothetical protein
VARNEVDVLFHLCKPQEFGSTLLRTDRIGAVVAALRRAGDKPARTEEEIFKRAEVPFVAPERREVPTTSASNPRELEARESARDLSRPLHVSRRPQHDPSRC